MLEGDRVRVVDTGSASAAVAMLGLAIQRRLEAGTTDEEVEALVARFQESAHLIFTVETLEYLAKGGRIGRARAWAGQLLNVKPILALEDGAVIPVKRVRGNHKAMLEFVAAFKEGSEDVPELHVAVAHADAPAKGDALVAMVRDVRPQAQLDVVASLGSVVGTHAGPGAVGFFWFTDADPCAMTVVVLVLADGRAGAGPVVVTGPEGSVATGLSFPTGSLRWVAKPSSA